ncbi:SDR family oxidoreductase [Roseomonas hellenica]|uniref:SDR family oxidoreductase n=1 Tax=Plastoroseomonas hellenica TaxID=2687306 RepID=A0ABS5F818_9PROT|nr:SDR family oxidoreductase [Plastoroseomonas hellenica]MBR0668720.1 SDR family oxidoreductase [Plastoroseomonas hellenica]
MKIDLTGRTAIVTGSTKGIGRAIAKGLAEAGATVVVTGRRQAEVDAVVAAIGRGARGHAADLGTAAGCAALVAAEPAVDILVNNAGIFPMGDVLELDDAHWEMMFQVNVMSAVRLTRAWLPGMLSRGWGRAIFLSSESGLNIPVDMVPYGVTKTALLAVSRGFAKRAAGTGVTVNAVLPGPTISDGFEAFFTKEIAEGRKPAELGVEFVKAHRPSSIIQRAATVEEVANLVVYTASPQASATTGAALRVDGGVVDSIA